MALLEQDIEDLTYVSNVSSHDWRTVSPEPNADDIINSELVSTLAPRRLVLAMSDAAPILGHSSMRRALRLDVWHCIHTVRALELQYIRADSLELLQLIQGFPSLDSVLLHGMAFHHTRGQIRSDEGECIGWLSFCLNLRQAMPNVKINLRKLLGPTLQQSKLPDCAVAWICNMAVPPGAIMHLEREERLRADFRSFLPLWAAEEEDDRGRKALQEWDGILGRTLCDAAMSRRWR